MPNLQEQTNQFQNKLLNVESRCKKCTVSSLCLPSGLSNIELAELESIIASSQIVNKNQALFSSGENFESLYVAHSGMFKTTTIEENGKERIISFHLPGEIMGLDGIHSGICQSTAIALTLSSYCKIPYNSLLNVAEDHPIIQQNLLKVMSKELYGCKKNHLDIGSKAKLALFIRTISQRFKIRGYSEKEFFLPISQRDIANYLGMAEETLSRIFKVLQKQSAITYKKHLLTILDKDLLSKISGF
ncbi:Fumarate and nitrate reduction regulatory protein [hydrothermal vent metagenome]|uniref:Fumarate and nitrate reduction regulatory protein n=1 Tax=hydrothermal vent metagenome TaxID=652676 RepID=A0A3B0VGV2_9ZZZZ